MKTELILVRIKSDYCDYLESSIVRFLIIIMKRK